MGYKEVEAVLFTDIERKCHTLHHVGCQNCQQRWWSDYDRSDSGEVAR
jgi:hypothetical protein